MIIDYDILFYRYCIGLKRPEEEFYRSTLARLIKMIDMAAEEIVVRSKTANNEPYTSKYFCVQSSQAEVATSMKEVAGFV